MKTGIDVSKEPEYIIGVDTYDKNALVGIKVDGVFEMLGKTMRDTKEFEKEVEFLTKYFNADILELTYNAGGVNSTLGRVFERVFPGPVFKLKK